MQRILKHFPIILFITAIFIITAVLIMEHFFGLTPCKLCLYQRIAYYLIIILAIINFSLKSPRFEKLYISSAAILLILTAILSFYHAGIEYGIFVNIVNCQDLATADSLLDLLKELSNRLAVDCGKPAFKFILSLSGWNFFLSSILGISAMMFIFKSKRKLKK